MKPFLRLPPVLALPGALLATAFSSSPLTAQTDAFTLDGLVVTASPLPRSEDAVAAHVTVLSGERLRVAGRSLAEALRTVAGVDVVRGGSFGAVSSVFLRGAESDHTLVLVDGVRVNQPGGAFDFSTLTTDNVERVEIVRGPASALYGSDAVAGVVHVVTRTGSGPPRARLGVESGAYGRRDVRLAVAGGGDGAAYSLGVARAAGNGMLAFNNGVVTTTVSGRARVRPDAATDVDLSVRSTDHEYHFPTDGSGAVVDRNAFTYAEATTLSLSARRRLGAALALEARIGTHGVDGGTDDAQDGPADTLGFYGFTSLDRMTRAFGEARVHVQGGRARLTGGIAAERSRVRSFTESLSEFGPSSGRSTHERDDVAVFAHASGDVGGLSYETGARLEDNERFGRFATWQAGASVALPGGSTRLRLSAGRALKEPTFFENFATGFAVGNPDLDPERSTSVEVGLEHGARRGGLTARATVFAQRLRDLIQYTPAPPEPGDPSFFNVAAADAHGVEVEVGVAPGRLSVVASGTWLRTRVRDAGFDAGPGAAFVEGEPLLRRPGHRGSVRADLDAGPGLRLGAAVRLVGAREDRDFSTFPASPARLSSYRDWSLSATWEVGRVAGAGPALTLDARLENALDARYEEIHGFRAPGRAFYLGGRVELGGV